MSDVLQTRHHMSGDVYYTADMTFNVLSACFVGMLYMSPALTLSFGTQWPVGPVDVKSYWPPKKLLAHFFLLKKPLFLLYSNYIYYIALQVEGCEFGRYLFCRW